MIYHLEISSAARNDMADSCLWYEKQQKGLGQDFLQETFRVFEVINQNPYAFAIRLSGKFRFSRTERFQYLIVYEIIEDRIIVNAVFHTSRNPLKF